MFYINNNPILANDMDVLLELKTQLANHGIKRFNEFKVSTKNIQFNCPIHNDGQERKPSCGILTQKQGDTPSGTVHCFTCGYTSTLEEMVSHCFGRDDNGVFGREWLVKNFLTVSIEDRKEIVLDLSRGKRTQQTQYISEEELESYRYYHEYMYKRGLTNEVIEQFDIGYDKNFELKLANGKVNRLRCITFPVRDINGNTLFIGRRSVDTKFFHYPEDVEKPVYGVYELHQLTKHIEEVIVCESFFNAHTCYVYGKIGVALLGLGTEKQYQQLLQLPVRKYITAFDPDDAGRRATQRFKKAMRGRKLVTSYVLPQGKDINDLTEKEFNELQEVF